MDINESNSHLCERQLSRVSDNVIESKKSTQKDVHDSHLHESRPSRDSENGNESKKSTEKSVRDSVFINQAEIAWHQRRRAWIGDRSQRSQRMPREPIMSWTTTYEDLLLSTEPFHQPIPLAEMVDFLVDVWLEEGLYD